MGDTSDKHYISDHGAGGTGNHQEMLREEISSLRQQLKDLKQVEEALRESRENFLDIFETVREGIAYTTLRGKILAVNSRLEHLVGIEAGKLVGRNILRLTSSLLGKQDLDRVLPVLSDLLHGRDISPFQVHFNNRILEIEANINRSSKRITGTIRDITEARNTQEALRKSEERLRRAELASRSGNWELHLDTGLMIGSEGAMKLYGVDTPVMDYTIAKTIPLPEYRGMMDNELRELIEHGKPYNIEFRIRNQKTGEIMDIHSVCEYDPEKRILFGSIQDITDRKKAEDELRSNSNNLSQLLEISVELMETIDRRKVFERIVKGTPGLTGMEAGAIYLVRGDELYLETSNPPLSPDFPEEFRQAKLKNHPHIARTIRERTTVILADTEKEPLTPEERIIVEGRNLRSLIYIPLFANKEVVGVLIFGTIGKQHDFTEQEKDMCIALSNMSSLALENSLLVQNLTLARDKAEESDRLKTAFLHNISHEIRTPLNAIVGFSGFLDQPDLTEDERKEYIDIIFQSNNQLLSIINDILNISQIETGQVTLRESDCNLILMLRNLHHQFLGQARSSGLELRLNLPVSGFDKAVRTDEHKLIQVLSNLLNNALKFTHEGYVELGILPKGSDIEFYVEDSGIGIDQAEHEKIFERFYQVDKSVSRMYSGTGLGLSISEAYVRMLGGKFYLESAPGKGSRFSFTIPWKPTDTQAVSVEKVSAPSGKIDIRKTILVAEDEESNFALVNAILKPLGYNIIRAKNGQAAVELCLSRPEIDLVLMDLKMPLLDGFQATREILKHKAGLPVIAQTAYAHSADRDKAMEIGCVDYLAKPFDRKHLIEVVSRYLR
jgi:PAS domain S-box-containing protein